MTYRDRRFPGRGYGHWHGPWHGDDDSFPRGRRGRRFASREELISALEQYQRNLEQRAADVAEKLRRLRAKEAGEAESPEGTDASPTTHNV
jgi:hypothetical protein